MDTKNLVIHINKKINMDKIILITVVVVTVIFLFISENYVKNETRSSFRSIFSLLVLLKLYKSTRICKYLVLFIFDIVFLILTVILFILMYH